MTSDSLGRADAKLSRRTLAKGAAWSVPVIAASAAAPAYAASPCEGACYTYDYGQHAVGTSANGLTGTATSSVCSRNTKMTTTLNMGGTPGTVSGITASTGKYSSTFNGKIDYRGEQANYPASNAYKLPGVSAADPGLILNIGSNTTTTVTFTFPAAVKSASVTILDITRSNNTINGNAFRYIDTVTMNQPWTMTGNMTSASRTSGAAGQTFSRTAQLESSTPLSNVMSTNSTGSFTSLTLSYSAPTTAGWQFIAIPQLTFCLA